MSSWQNVKLTKCQVDKDLKLAKWQVDKMTSWQSDKLTSWQNDKLTKCWVDKTSSWQNDHLIQVQVDKMPSYRNDHLTQAQVDKMPCRQDDKLSKWHNTNYIFSCSQPSTSCFSWTSSPSSTPMTPSALLSRDLCYKTFYGRNLWMVIKEIQKGEVSLYHWPPVWLVWIGLFCK